MRALNRLVLLALFLSFAGCGGGGGNRPVAGGTGEQANTSISISPTSVSLSFVEGTSAPSPTPVRVNFVGDGIVVGYGPGVTPPTWLSVNRAGSSATTADFSLSVSNSLQPGTYSTSVRFVTGRVDGADTRTVDLPVTLTVTANDLALTVTPTPIAFATLTPGPTPAAQTLTASFNGSSVSVSGAPNWLTVTPPSNSTVSPAAFTLTVNDTTFPAGTNLAGQLTFTTTRSGSTFTRTVNVPVTFRSYEAFSAIAPTLAFESIRGASTAIPDAGYAITIQGGLAQWRVSAAPAWLDFSATSGSGPATVTVTADPTGHEFGIANGEVTITDDHSGRQQSFAVSLSHRAARLTVAPASLAFAIDSMSSASALTQTIVLSDEFGGTQPTAAVAWSVRSISVPWLTTSSTSGSSAPEVQLAIVLDKDGLGELQGGDHSGVIELDYVDAQSVTHSVTVPVTLNNRLARVEFVGPYLGRENVAGSIFVRGTHFDTTGSQVLVRVGSNQIGPLNRDSATQVTVNYPALPAGRYPVSLANAAGVTPTAAELVIQAPSIFTYQSIAAPARRTKLVYDAERLSLFAVNRLDQQIEQYDYSGGTWSAVTPLVIPDVTDIALAPDGRSLIVLTEGEIREADLNGASLQTELRATNADPSCGGFFDKLAMANNGKAFVVFNYQGCSGYSQSYLYDVRGRALVGNAYFVGYLYNGIVGGSTDGTRIYAGSNGVSPAPTVKIFNSLNDTVSDGSVNYNLNAIAVSGNASRVIFQNEFVYSRSLSLTGNLPNGGVVIASHDSSKAFVYRDDGGQARIVVYDLNGALLPGALYPELRTINLADSPNDSGNQNHVISMALTPDDSTLFISGNHRILVVPVN